MKVFLIFTSSNLGGAERSLTRMTLLSNDCDFSLATISGNGSWVDWCNEIGLNPITFGSGIVAKYLPFLPYIKLLSYLNENSYDVVYMCGVRLSLIIRLGRFMFPKTKIVHGVRWNPSSRSILDQFFIVAERLTKRLVDGYITNSNASKSTIENRCGISSRFIKTIHNGIESMPKLPPLIDSKPMEVLTVANLATRKGHFPFLKVIKLVKKQIPDVRFVFVGRDDMSGILQKKIMEPEFVDSVEYVGFDAEPARWYRRARIFALPSLRNEGCPTSILEAMSFSVPCVAYDIDGISELIAHGKTGLISSEGDYEAMANSIIKLLSQPKFAQELGNNGHNSVSLNFTIDRTCDHHFNYFSELISKSN